MLTANKNKRFESPKQRSNQTKVSKQTATPVLLPSTLMAMTKRVFFVFMVLAILTSVYSITRGGVQQAQAATPATLNFQARLMTSSGNLVPDGNYNIEFKLYNTASSAGSSQGSCTGDASCLWTETRVGGDQVQVKNGYLSAYLGDVTALPSNIWDQQLWLTMNIGATGSPTWDGEMTPRIRMTSVPYAFQAKSSETLNKNTGSFTGTVDFATLTADRRYLFPDTSLATTGSPGTICVYNGSASNCPAASGSAYYIQNDTVLQTQSNFNIQGRDNGVDGTVVAAFQGAAGGQTVDLLQFKASGGTVLGAVTSTGNLQVASGLDTYTGTTLSIGSANATAVSIADTGITTTVNGALMVTEAFTANGGATITGIANINTTGSATTTIGNAAAGITLDGVVTANEAATFNDTVTIAAGQTIRLVGGATNTRPASPTEGMMYFDTTTKQLLIYANGKWQADTKTATFVVAASNSSQSDKDGAQYVADGEDSSGSGIGTLDGDQIQINNALDAAEAAGGGVVYLMGGTYTVDAAISIPNNVTLAGTGTSTLVRLGNFGATSVTISAIASKDTSTATNVNLRDIRIDGRNSVNTNGTQYGIIYTSVGNTGVSRAGGRISNVTVENFRNYAVSLFNSSSNIVTGVTVNNSGGGLETTGTSFTNVVSMNTFNGGAYGVTLGSGGTLVSNNVITNSTTAGIHVQSALNNITGNVIGGTGGSTTMNSIHLATASATDNTVTNNAMSDAACSTTCYAINIDAASVRNYLADNGLGTVALPGTINNLAGTSTILAGQLSSSSSGNYQIQPAGTIELMKNTNVTGNLSPTANNTYDLGTSSLAWRTGYFGTSVITPLVDRATAGALGIGTTNATNITIGHNAGTFAVDGTNFDLSTTGVLTLAGGQSNDITTSANTNLTIQANGTGTISLNDTVTIAGTTTFSGVATDITTGTNEDLTVIANGTGIINLNDDVIVGGTITLSGAATDITTATNEDLTVVANGTGVINLNDTVSVAGNFTVTNAGNVAFQRNVTDYTATGTQDNVNFGTGVLFRITSASAVTINGIAGGADGRIITLVNASANDVTLGNSASSTPANHIITGTGGSLVLPAGASAQLAYDSSAPGTWRVIGGTATAGGGANRQLSNLSGTVAINLGLVPAAASDNALDLGSATYGWRSLYADTSVLTPLVGRATAGTLAIGTDTNSTAVTISRTGVLTTVAGGLQVNEATELRGGLTVTNGGNVAFQTGASVYSAVGTQSDVNFGTGALFRITSASALTINSIAGGADGRLITLINASANPVTLSNDTGATAGNRIITGTGASITIPAGASLTLAYDSADTRWRVIGSTAATNGYIQLAPGSAQTDTSANASVFINDTGGGNLLQLQSGGVNKFVVSADGATTISNASTSTALQITQTGNTSASTSVGGALNINNTGNTGAGLVIYSNQATPSGRLFVVRADQATFNQSAAYIDMGGSGAGLTIAQSNVAKGGTGGSGLIISNDAGDGTTAAHGISVNLTGSGNASASAANFVSSNTAHSAVQISGSETGRGTLKITHTGTGTDGNASAISIDLQGSGTASQGIFLDSTSGTTGKLLNIRNAGTEYLTLDANGQLGLNTSGTPTARLDVRGTALFAGDSASFFRIQNSSSQTLFVADTTSQRVAIGPAAVAANSILTIGTNTTAASGGIYFGTDTNLYRSAAGELRTDGNLSLGQGANRTLSVQTRTSNAAGNNLTVSAGNAGSGASAFGGGTLNLQGGGAAGTGNANGGAVVIAGGAGTGTGYQGLVNLSTTAFSSSATVTAPAGITNVGTSFVDLYSTIPVNATATTAIVSIGDPGVTTIGRVLYVSALRTSTDFTLRLNAASTPIDIAMKANSTATLIWNGERWTAAGASSSTDLQSAYNNTLTSAGGAELVLNAPGANADGFTIRNNASTPIVGGLLEVQTSIGTNLFSVNNRGTEHANNGGAETAGGSSTTFPANTWTAAPVSATIARTITAGQYVTGQAGVSVATTASANSGVRNNLSGTISNTIGAEYQVSFTAKSSVNGTPIDVIYSRDGGTSTEICTEYSSQTLSDSAWTKITCTVTISSATAPTDADLIIRKTNTTTPTIYIDNLSFQRNDTTTQPSNVQIGGGNDGGPITLFTLDRASAPPVAAGDETYYGSMYYDTITGSIQCYEADGWGACGSPPDNIITLTPEYTGAVLNGNGIGVLTADFCANQAGTLSVNTSFCASGLSRQYYRWTSPQATEQVYSIYVSHKLPGTFKEFNNNNTITLTAFSDNVTNGTVSYEVFRSTGSAVTRCWNSVDQETLVTTSNSTWQTVPVNGNEQSCGFASGDNVIFKINVKSRSNANVYVENLNFTYTNK